MSPGTRPRRHRGWIKRTVTIVAASAIVLAGLLVGGVRLLDHFAPQYRNALAARIGQRIDSSVQISGLEIGWGWRGPILYLDDPRITHHGADTPALTAERLGLEFSIADLIGGSRLPDGVIVERPKARLVSTEHGLSLAHWARSPGQGLTSSKLDALRSRLTEIRITDGQITIESPRLPQGRLHWSDLDLHLVDQGDQKLAAELSAEGPAWWPRLNASATLQGRLRAPDQARFNVHTTGLRPLAIARRSREAVLDKLRGGTIDLDLRGRWQNHRLADTRLTLDSQTLSYAGQAHPLVPAFQAIFTATSDPDRHEITLALAELSGGPQAAADLDAQARLNTRTRALDVHAKQLPGPLAVRIARLAVPRLARTDIDGSIDDLDMHWQPQQPLKAALGFEGLQVADPKIAFGPVSGRYEQQDDQHTLRFTDAGGHLAAQRYIRGQLDVSDLSGAIHWQPAADGAWSVKLDQLRLASDQAHLTTNGHIRLPAEGAPIVNVTADAVAPHMPRLLAHIPQAEDLPNPRLRDWLPKAISAGALDQAHVEIKGAMDRFPFPEAGPEEGFHMTLSGHGVDVRYKPDWPRATHARGTLSLDGDTLDLDMPAAQMLGVDVSDTQAHIDNVREPVIHLTGHAHNAPGAKLLAFLAQSPLRDKFGKLVEAIELGGRDDLGVTLRVPLKPGLGDIKVDGTIDAQGNTLRQAALPGPITDIRGRLRFSRDGLRAAGLTGDLLGVPVTADLTPADDGAQQIVAHASPKLPDDRQALAHYLPSPWLVYGRGQSPMTVAFKIDGNGQISPIQVTSDLVGMALDLPAPLTKKPETAAPLKVTIDPDSEHIDADYDQRLHLGIDLDAGQPQRITALLGDTSIQPPEANGLWIGGDTDQVDGLGWFYVVRHVLYGAPADVPNAAARVSDASDDQQSAGSMSALTFLGGDLTMDRLNFGDRYIANPHVRAQPMHDTTGWRVDFEGNDSQGQITWTAAADQPMSIAGNLKRIALQTETPAQDANTTTQDSADSTVLWPDVAPGDLPKMQVYVQNFVVDDTSFGQAHLDARSSPNRWTLDRFELEDGALTGKINAHWQQHAGLTTAGAQVDFDGHGLSRLLRTIGYVSPVQAKKARINADLSIAPNKRGLDLRYLDGHVVLKLDDGALLTVEPGPGRLLGLFNLYVLPRRLRLDFRDVVDKGMAFDKVRAKFRILQGQAYSDDTHIATPSSKIGITGRIGLATRDYDEYVTITPKVGSGVAIASAVLGGPVVGAAVFAVQELLKKPIQYFSSVGYNLKGSWDDPQIVNPSANGTDDPKDQADDSRSAEDRAVHPGGK
ncbi:YhdP family protein [Salinisphaera sp. SPP-AMP-43]|uniref:YhdP family protein n=1 Tax=Salinisphaera sp. SPP-AMP-43 TaxID=3121288 RepID=UPI003C6E1E5C